MVRKHVGELKLEYLEGLEETAGITLSDEAWDALASRLQILALESWIRQVIKNAQRVDN